MDDYLGAGSRLQGVPAATLAASAFAHELRAAPYLWPGLAHADAAHLAMLVDAGIVGPDDAGILLDAIEQLAARDPASLDLDPEAGDVYNNRDRMLVELAGERAGFIHAGRARREATTIAWQLACRDRLLRVGAAGAGLLTTLVEVAARHRGDLMADFTYLHHAQPTTLGHYLLGFAWPVARDLDRVRRALDLVNRSPAGSGSVNGTRLPLDRRLAARLLECDTIVEHTRDAMWAPDMALEQMSVVVSLATTLDRLVEDLQVWLLGVFTGIAASGLTTTGQPDNRIFAYESVPEALDRTAEAAEFVADALDGATFVVHRMAESAASGYTYATDVCDVLVLEAGIDNRTAHRIVGRAVRDALQAGTQLDAAALARAAGELGLPAPRIEPASIENARSPAHIVASRTTPGGAAPEPLGDMLDALGARAAREVRMWAEHPLHGFAARVVDGVRQLLG
jgi:argininosuccinate lyase